MMYGDDFDDGMIDGIEHGLNVSSKADVVESDVTHPECSSCPYCLNCVTCSPDTNRFEVVLRVKLNKKPQHSYRTIASLRNHH